jgi:hypothetical protein
MKKPLAAFLVLGFLSVLLVTTPNPVVGAIVFTDSFSSGNFGQWSLCNVTAGANQIVNEGVARFSVPQPVGGTSSYSFIVKDGFTSTANSIIVAKEDVFLSDVPSGSAQGNSAIFFLYICDSTNLNGNYGNVGVGIDGSNVWSLWVGGCDVYSYVFQTAGSAPVSNTWYHLVLTVNNPDQRVTLEVNGAPIISVPQQQFTEKNHPVSLMVGMGENWWSNGPKLEIGIDNVQLDISDSISPTAPVSTPKSASTPNPIPMPTVNPTMHPTHTPSTETPTVNSTTATPLAPSLSPLNPTSSLTNPNVTLEITFFQATLLTGTAVAILATLMVLRWRQKKH